MNSALLLKCSLLALILCGMVPHALMAANERGYYEAGVDALEKEDYGKAIEFFRKAIRANPNVPQIYNALGLSLLRKNNAIKPAQRAFQKAVDLDPRYAEPHFNMGSYYAGTVKDPVLAIEQFEKAVKIDPEFAKAYMGLGWVYLEKEDAQRSNENFEKAVQLDPALVDAQYGLGLSYAALRKNELTLRPITILRSLGRNDLAQAIENLIQGEKPKISDEQEGSETGSGPEVPAK